MDMKIMYDHSFGHVWPKYHDLPKKLPHEFMEPLRKRLESNHGQTLERLNERGGLSPAELYLGINDLGIRDMPRFAQIRGIVAILDLLKI